MAALIMNPGRCGSTLLSNLLGRHPDVLPVQEYMISLGSLAYTAPEPLTGNDFWEVLSGPSAIEGLLRRLDRVPSEVVYTGGIRTTRGQVTAMPRVLGVALVASGTDPDRLFGRLAEQVPAFPTQDLGAHHRQLFELLVRELGRRTWVERSGGNCGYSDRLVSMFPDARVVYLHRNCLDTVLSMRRHPYFQLATIGEQFERLCALNPFDEDCPIYEDGIPAALRPYLPQHLTADLLDRRGELLEPFVLRWVEQDLKAQAVLAALGDDQQLEVDFDDLVHASVAELTRVGEFLGLDGVPAWVAGVSGRVSRPADRSTAQLRTEVESWRELITDSILTTGSYQPTTVA